MIRLLGVLLLISMLTACECCPETAAGFAQANSCGCGCS